MLTRLLLVIMLAGTLVLGIPTLALPYWRDQSIFALVGDVITRGGFPYRDAFDFKPPGIHLVYALAALLARGEMWGARVLDLASLLLGVTALFRLLLPVSRRAAGIAAAHFALGYLGCLGFRELGQPEGFATTLVLWSLLLVRSERRRHRRAILGGLSFGAAVLMKYTVILYLPLHVMLVRGWTRIEDRDGQVLDVWPEKGSPITRWLTFGLSTMVPLVGAGLYLAFGRALDAFVEIQTQYLPGYSQLTLTLGTGPALLSSLRTVAAFFADRPFLVSPPLVGLALLAFLRNTPQRAVPLFGILLTVAAVVAQGKFFHYHWIPILPFLAWATGAGFDGLLRLFRERRWQGRVLAGILLALGLVALDLSRTPITQERVQALKYLRGQLSREEFYASPAFGRYDLGDYAVGATWEAVSEVKELCPLYGRLFVWGFEPYLYLGSDRLPASRFIYTAPLVSPWCPESWRKEIVTTLTEKPPELIVVMTEDAMPWVTGLPYDSRVALQLYPAIGELIRDRYEMAGRVEHFYFFRKSR